MISGRSYSNVSMNIHMIDFVLKNIIIELTFMYMFLFRINNDIFFFRSLHYSSLLLQKGLYMAER